MVRLVPEVLSYPYPIGFDTVHYAARMKSGVIWYHWTSVFSTWLLYAILIPAYEIIRSDPFLLLKIVAPTLYALNVCGVYYFAKKALNWENKKALMAAFFFAFQLASLRLSWDLYKNVLGLGILLFTLPLIKSRETKKSIAIFVLLSILVVFSHGYASVTMFAVIFGVIVSDFLKDERKRLSRVFTAAFPALVIFLASIYFSVFSIPSHVEMNIISAQDTVHPSPGGLSFLVNYMDVVLPFEYYPTYMHLASHVLSLFSLLYLPWMPLVFLGFFGDKILNCWTLLLLVGSFSALIMPFCALDLWFRWMLMLVYPFTFYAANGVQKVLDSQGGGIAPSFRWLKWMKVSNRSVLGIASIIVLLGSIFMTTPLFFDKFGVFSVPTTYTYVPSTMLHNTIPLRDVKGTIEVLEWLNGNMIEKSCVLLQHPFISWASLYLDNKHVIISYEMDVERALDVALNQGFNFIYLVGWNENIGWYGFSVPKDFAPIFSSDRISVFKKF